MTGPKSHNVSNSQILPACAMEIACVVPPEGLIPPFQSLKDCHTSGMWRAL